MSRYTTVSIPKPLADRLKQRLEGTSFNTLSNFTTYILRMMLTAAEMRSGPGVFTRKDEEEVKKVLRAMGYI